MKHLLEMLYVARAKMNNRWMLATLLDIGDAPFHIACQSILELFKVVSSYSVQFNQLNYYLDGRTLIRSFAALLIGAQLVAWIFLHCDFVSSIAVINCVVHINLMSEYQEIIEYKSYWVDLFSWPHHLELLTAWWCWNRVCLTIFRWK